MYVKGRRIKNKNVYIYEGEEKNYGINSIILVIYTGNETEQGLRRRESEVKQAHVVGRP